MLEIKGEISLLDTLQMLKILEGSYIIRTEDAEIHVKDGNITWFSLGDSQKLVEYVASYRGRVQVENAPAKEVFHLPIDEAVLQAAFIRPAPGVGEEEEKENIKCPTPETGWFALVTGSRLIKTHNTEEGKVREVVHLWEAVSPVVDGLSEMICTGDRGSLYILREGKTLIMGYCTERKFLGILRQAVRRLSRHVDRKDKEQI